MPTPTPEQLALVSFIIMAAFTVQTTLGFGAGLIAIPLMSFIIGTKDAVTVLLVFQFLGGVIIFYIWKDIPWRKMILLIPSVAIGVASGFLLNGYLNEHWITLILGIYILFFVFSQILAAYGFSPFKPHAVFSGPISGILHTLFGTGGPPLIAYMHAQDVNQSQFRAALLSLFFVMNIMRVGGAAQNNLLMEPIIILILAAIPGFYLSLRLGNALHGKIPASGFRGVILVMLVVFGSILIYRASTNMAVWDDITYAKAEVYKHIGDIKSINSGSISSLFSATSPKQHELH
ncbi:MAG: sulfite exporter TauE/SafE family protein [Alphaproteobacteria bacterium]